MYAPHKTYAKHICHITIYNLSIHLYSEDNKICYIMLLWTTYTFCTCFFFSFFHTFPHFSNPFGPKNADHKRLCPGLRGAHPAAQRRSPGGPGDALDGGERREAGRRGKRGRSFLVLLCVFMCFYVFFFVLGMVGFGIWDIFLVGILVFGCFWIDFCLLFFGLMFFIVLLRAGFSRFSWFPWL